MNITPITLTGERVRLEPITRDHAAGLLEAGQSLDIWAYMPMAVNTEEAVHTFIENALRGMEAGTDHVFTIFDQETGRILGSTRYLDIQPANRNLEIGWTWLNPSVWRTRVNTECKFLLLRHAFETLGCLRVQIKADGRNERSKTAIARLGATYEGTLRKQRIMWDGYVRDSAYFSILDNEWPDVKTRLEGFLAGQ
jgi:N-acetyltransferase